MAMALIFSPVFQFASNMKNHYYLLSAAFLFVLMITISTSCNQKPLGPPLAARDTVTVANISIRELRNMHTMGTFRKINEDKIITGIVVADDKSGNFYKSIVIQDSTGGITIKMDGFNLHALYPVGRRVFIKLNGLWLGDYARMIQLGAGIDSNDASSPQLAFLPTPLFDQYIIRGTTGNIITPNTVTINSLNDQLQSTLVRINAAEFIPTDANQPFADDTNNISLNRVIRTCDGNTVAIRTSGYASFAGLKTPSGNGTVTAIYSVFFGTRQLIIRDTSDLRMNDANCSITGGIVLLNQLFETTTTNNNINLPGWRNIAQTGNRNYVGKLFSGNRYAEIAAFGSGQATVTSWLITPGINLNATINERLSFLTKDGFDNGAQLRVLISTNYDGGLTPWTATWIPLTATLSSGNSSGFAPTWINSGNIDISAYTGTIYIAFRYEGTDPASGTKRTTTFQIDDVRVWGN